MKHINFRKSSKLGFYLRSFIESLVPRTLLISHKNKLLNNLLDNLPTAKKEYLDTRVNYYLKYQSPFNLAEDAIALKDYKLNGKSAYFYDLKSTLNYFPLSKKIRYLFGDVTHVESSPTIVKSRPIAGDNKNSIVMKLDTVRHFNFVNDVNAFVDKKDMAVWRGKLFEGKQPHREVFFEAANKLGICNLGKTNNNGNNPEWVKQPMSITEQLKYKFVFCVEGNDVATSLKWVMSSNSIALMCKPKFETWFMEGNLEAGKHYIELKEDYSDLAEKLAYYSTNVDEAEEIIHNANEYVQQFKDKEQEKLISLMVMDKFFRLSGQP